MEDAVTRTHAQQLVAAALYVGSRVAGDLMRRVLEHPNRVELRADGLAHTPENAERLQSAAARASRQALGEAPTVVVAAPDPRGGWRVQLAFAAQRPPLQAWELSDLQQAWGEALQRLVGRDTPQSTTADTRARQHDLDQALAALRQAQGRLFAEPTTETREAFHAAINRAQIASDGLRTAIERANPMRFDRPTRHDQLDFRVTLQGDEGLTLRDRDRVVRDAFARAAALPDPSELRVFVRPTDTPRQWHASVSFNFRNTTARGPQHLNPATLARAIQAGATSVPALSIQAAGTLAQVTITAVQAARRPIRDTLAPEPSPARPERPLAPPSILSPPVARERVRP
jgi:hypothetical protein